jgi:predicted nucleotidyltransferase
VYGSVAKGTDSPGSDVDVLVIGKVSTLKAQAAFKAVARKYGRPVNAMATTSEALAKELAAGSGFWTDVMQGPLLVLQGELPRPSHT